MPAETKKYKYYADNFEQKKEDQHLYQAKTPQAAPMAKGNATKQTLKRNASRGSEGLVEESRAAARTARRNSGARHEIEETTS